MTLYVKSIKNVLWNIE